MTQLIVRNASNHRRQRRGKERRLTLSRSLAKDCLYVFDKAHAQHLIGFIKNHEADLIERQGAALQVIEHSAWRSDDDLCTARKLRKLPTHRVPTEDGQHRDLPKILSVRIDRGGHLQGQLSRRTKHQRLDRANTWIERVQKRKCKRCGLARSGLRLSEQVATFEKNGNGSGLNRGRSRITFVADRANQRFRKAQICEGILCALVSRPCFGRLGREGSGFRVHSFR